MTSVPARGPQADSANSAASRRIKNHSSNHDARYNDFAEGNGSGQRLSHSGLSLRRTTGGRNARPGERLRYDSRSNVPVAQLHN